MSKPDDIPQDVWETVLALPMEAHGALPAIARAITAERERAAGIAELEAEFQIEAAKLSLPTHPSPLIAKDRAVVAKRIAVSIRRGDQP